MPLKKPKIKYPEELIARYYQIIELFSHPSMDAALEEQTRLLIEQDKRFWQTFKQSPSPVVQDGRKVGTVPRPTTNDERNISGGYLEGMKAMSLATLEAVVKSVIKNHEKQEREKKK